MQNLRGRCCNNHLNRISPVMCAENTKYRREPPEYHHHRYSYPTENVSEMNGNASNSLLKYRALPAASWRGSDGRKKNISASRSLSARSKHFNEQRQAMRPRSRSDEGELSERLCACRSDSAVVASSFAHSASRILSEIVMSPAMCP